MCRKTPYSWIFLTKIIEAAFYLRHVCGNEQVEKANLMSIPLAQRFHLWFGKNLTLPDDLEEVTRQKKTFFNANIGVVLVVGTLTCTTWLLGLPVLCSYGFGLVAFNVTLIAIFLKTKRLSPYFSHFQPSICAAFYLVHHHQVGVHLLRVDFCQNGLGRLFTPFLPSKKLAWWSFLLFVATTVLEAALYPWLTPAPEMTPAINQAFFVINATWISPLFMLLIVFYVFKQRQIWSRPKPSDCKKWTTSRPACSPTSPTNSAPRSP